MTSDRGAGGGGRRARCWDGCSGFAGRHRALHGGRGVCRVCHAGGGRAGRTGDRARLPRSLDLPDLGPFDGLNSRPSATCTRQRAAAHSARPRIPVHHAVRRHPPVVREAILAAEDKRFFAHDGVDYATVPRVLFRIRTSTLIARLLGIGPADQANAPAIFPQEGSTITQQLGTRSLPQRADVAGKQRPAPGTRPAAPFALVRAGRAKCEHDCPQGGGDAALRLDRT